MISYSRYNNNSPRIFKRSFHSTKSLGYFDFILEALNIFALENMESIISQARIHLEAQDFSHNSVTKAVNFLLSDTKIGDKTHAEFWKFDISKLQGNGIQSEDALKEFQNLETRMKNNLDNHNSWYEIQKRVNKENLTQKEALRMLRKRWNSNI